MKNFLLTCGFLGAFGTSFAQELILPQPSVQPSRAQQEQIARKYGMFIHFGINTFHDEEWTDGSKPASSYAPSAIDAEQWIRTAKEAGMKYVILIAKHHDGFCLWDSRYTEYDVASSGNPTNVIEAVARACRKYDIGLGLYYSLWDRKANADVEDWKKDEAYNQYMLNQLTELMDIVDDYTKVVEFWFDGGWMGKAELPLARDGHLSDHQAEDAGMPGGSKLDHRCPGECRQTPGTSARAERGISDTVFPQ